MAQVATSYRLIPVSVLAHNGGGWNEGDQTQNARTLNAFIQDELLPKYNIDKRRIFFSGQSSGGGFLSSHFIALHGANYQGGAFCLCGMQPPQRFTATEAMKTGFKVHFEITTGDGIWTSSFQPSVQAYQNAGLTVTSDSTKRGGHCQFDQAQVIEQRIGAMLTP